MRPIDRSVLLSQEYWDSPSLKIFHGSVGMTFDDPGMQPQEAVHGSFLLHGQSRSIQGQPLGRSGRSHRLLEAGEERRGHPTARALAPKQSGQDRGSSIGAEPAGYANGLEIAKSGAGALTSALTRRWRDLLRRAFFIAQPSDRSRDPLVQFIVG
jgi:hypothetical protein